MRNCCLACLPLLLLLPAHAAAEDCNTNGVGDGGEVTFLNGYALDLDGNQDFVDITTGPELNLSYKFTIEAWVRSNSASGPQRIISNRAAGGGYAFGQWDGKLLLTTFAVKDYLTSNVYLTTGQWMHVAVVLDGSMDAHFYVNGAFVETVTGTQAGHPSEQPVNIGRNPTGDKQYWNGGIDEVRVWNYMRTAAEIADNFDQHLTGDETTLVAYWRLDEGSGPETFDMAGDNDGNLLGSPPWITSSTADCNTNRALDACELADGSALDCNTNGQIDTCDSSQTWGQSGSLPIPDGGTLVTLPITVGFDLPVLDVDVSVDIEHPFVTELSVALCEGSTTVELADDLPASNGTENMSGTVFDDEAPYLITEGFAPYPGTFRPLAPLSAFDGRVGPTTWTLHIDDDGSQTATGALLSWTLHLATCSTDDCNTDTVPDVCQPDCDADGTIDACEIDGPVTACTFSGLQIPDNGSVSSSITISVDNVVTDVNVGVTILYSQTSDLWVKLKHDQTEVVLAKHDGGGSNFTNTWFDDSALVPIDYGQNPFTGTFKPQSPLSPLSGAPAAGDWTLEVIDVWETDNVGFLYDWSLSLTTTVEDCNSNAVPDGCETDCDTSGVPDECESFADCNTNGIPDPCDIAGGVSAGDCNTDEVPDECQDCNTNTLADACDVPQPDVHIRTPGIFTHDLSEVTDSMTLPEGPALHVSLKLNVTHPYMGETAWGLDRDGAAISLMVFLAGVNADIMFDDNADAPPPPGGPLLGSFKPGQPLDTLMDGSQEGVWTLHCYDNSWGNSGVINQWSLQFATSVTADADCNTNFVVDACEPEFVDCDTNTVWDDCELVWGTAPDCNTNAQPDSCDVALSDDCDSNAVPDECDEDCDTNGTVDACDLGPSNDCDGNGVPDACDPDCDTNGAADACEWADCNTNDLMDVCESQAFSQHDSGVLGAFWQGAVHSYTFTPIEAHDDVSFTFHVRAATDHDIEIYLNGDFYKQFAWPDIPYCWLGAVTYTYPKDAFNANFAGIPLTIEMVAHANMDPCWDDEQQQFNSHIRAVVSYDVYAAMDCDTNGLPDECQPDDDTCNPNGIPDVCDADCNSNGVGDACEGGCNTNGVPDECEGGCNTNGIPDACDLTDGTLFDCNTNNMPDACETGAPLIDQQTDWHTVFPPTMSHDDTDTPEYTAKAWDDVSFAAPVLLGTGQAYMWPYWDGYAAGIPFLVELADAPGGSEAGGSVIAWTLGAGRTDLSGIVDFDLDGVPLEPGTYWLSVQAAGGTNLGSVSAMTANSNAPNGSRYYSHNPGGGWGQGTDPYPAYTPRDLSFTLFEVVDCNTNTIPDECELSDDGALDQDDDGILDECQPVPGCPTCPGDASGDGRVDADDIQAFVACVLADGECDCTDLDGDGLAADIDLEDDVAAFVEKLTQSTEMDCP